MGSSIVVLQHQRCLNVALSPSCLFVNRWIRCNFSLVSSEAWGAFSTSKSDRGLVVWAVCSSASSIWPQGPGLCHMAQSFLIKAYPAHAQYFLEQLKSPLFNFFKKLPIIQNIIPEYLAQAYPPCGTFIWILFCLANNQIISTIFRFFLGTLKQSLLVTHTTHTYVNKREKKSSIPLCD